LQHNHNNSANGWSRVCVLHIVASDFDRALLVGPVPIWEIAADDVNGYRFVRFVDRVGAKRGDSSLHRCFVFLRSTGLTVIRREFGAIWADNAG
jgi:hypothetical protein